MMTLGGWVRGLLESVRACIEAAALQMLHVRRAIMNKCKSMQQHSAQTLLAINCAARMPPCPEMEMSTSTPSTVVHCAPHAFVK